MNGFTDKPTAKKSDDEFDVAKYTEGLSSFIKECDTPMTIAIQGDWGSGKTSMMNMVREDLGDKVLAVWFNTWQYSQFNMSDELSISLLTSLVESLDIEDDQSSKIRKTFQVFGNIAKKVTIIAADSFVGGEFAGEVKSFANKMTESQSLNIAKAISQIKEQFQNCVNIALNKDKKERIVFFIDDLDRLQPAKAVEVLEILKLFLDCDKCVFVLAIDYGVVSQGVKQKYGEMIGEEKGKSFFDKIIQVPFKMPVAQYNVKNYVKNMLKQLEIECLEKPDEVEFFVNLIQSSIGCNPRSMKRLFNAFLLLKKVASSETLTNEWNKKVLFAVLCLQLSFENVYNYLASNRHAITEEFLLTLADKEKMLIYQDADELRKELSIESDFELNRIIRFMKSFNRVVDRNDDMSFSDDEIQNFIKVIGFSTITSSSEVSATTENEEEIWKSRRFNRAIAKSLNEIMKKEDKIAFAVYQSNDDKGEDWKFHYASSYKWFWKNNLPYCVDVIISSLLTDSRSYVKVKISPRKNMTSAQLFEVFKDWSGESELSFSRTDYGYTKEFTFAKHEAKVTEKEFAFAGHETKDAEKAAKSIYDLLAPTIASLNGRYDRE